MPPRRTKARASSPGTTQTREPDTAPHFCMKCGSPGPFRKETAERCIECDEKAAVERRHYENTYHQKRNKVIRKLINAHREEFDRLMEEERVGVRRQRK